MADFCPYCRGLQSFSLLDVYRVTRFALVIQLGKEFLAHHKKCCGCNIRYVAEPAKYSAIEKALSPPGSLVLTTYPSYHRDYANRIAIEEKLDIDPHSVDSVTRRFLIREIFEIFSPQLDIRRPMQNIDLPMGFGCIATVILPILLFLSLAGTRVNAELLFGLALAILCLGLVASVILAIGEPHRFLRRSLLPRLSQGLKTIRPSREELVTCIYELAANGVTIGKLFDGRDTENLLQRIELWTHSFENQH